MALVLKAVNIGLLFYTTPLILSHTGKVGFGIWATLSGLFVSGAAIDLGVGNSLLNVIATERANGRNDACSEAIANAFVITACLGLCVIAATWFTTGSVNWQQMFGVDANWVPEVKASVLVFAVCVGFNLPLSLIQKIQFACQDGARTYRWQLLIAVISGLSLGITTLLHGNLWEIVAATLVPAPILNAVCWTTYGFQTGGWVRPALGSIGLEGMSALLAQGRLWLVLQAAAFVGTGVDTLLISRFYGAESVSEYAVLTRIASGLLVAQLLSAPLWPAVTDALERRDMVWAKRAFRNVQYSFAGIGLFAALAMAVGAQRLIDVWLGTAVVPSFAMVVGFAVWAFILNYFGSIASFMSNPSMLGAFAFLSGAAATVALVLKVWIGYFADVDALIWANNIGYLIACFIGFLWTRNAVNAKTSDNERSAGG